MKTNVQEMKEAAWENFHNGDYISDVLLLEMIDQTRKALEYLEARGERFFLATAAMHRDLAVLEGFCRSRGLR